MKKKSFELSEFRVEPLENAHYIKAMRANYILNGNHHSWEVVKAHDSVAILLYHTQKEAFVLVRQFRAAVYMHNQDGVTVELCAGIVDKALDLKQIAAEEIEEECGYRVETDALQKITSFYTSVGFAGSSQTLYYAEVDESMRVGEGGGVDEEEIEPFYLPVKKSLRFVYDESIAKTPGLMFALLWWHYERGGRG